MNTTPGKHTNRLTAEKGSKRRGCWSGEGWGWRVTNNLVRKSACRHSQLFLPHIVLSAAAARTGWAAIRLTEEVSFPSLTNSL